MIRERKPPFALSRANVKIGGERLKTKNGNRRIAAGVEATPRLPGRETSRYRADSTTTRLLTDSAPQILSLSTTDVGGGAEKMAVELHNGFRNRAWQSRVVVGEKSGNDPDVIPMHASPFFDYRTVSNRSEVRWQRALLTADWLRGKEMFHFPFTKWLLPISGFEKPRAVVAHNLHGGYFDLRMLSGISSQAPFFWYLHDMWSFTGHCAFPVGCNKWADHCRKCPDLKIPPAIFRDRAEENRREKSKIYESTRAHILVPCEWLARQVQKSILQPAATDVTVVPYGIDLDRFRPARRKPELRLKYGIPESDVVGIFLANRPADNPYKNFPLLAEAADLLKGRAPGDKRLRILAIGSDSERTVLDSGSVRLDLLPYFDEDTISEYLQMADFYVHPAHHEITPVAIYEAMACGLPTIASDVGGVSEMFDDGKEGILVRQADSALWADGLLHLWKSPDRREEMGAAARGRIEHLGGADRMVDKIASLVSQQTSEGTAAP